MAQAKAEKDAAEKKKQTILNLVQEQHQAAVQMNRQYLAVIIECLFYTAQQNIAQRAHEEDRTNLGNLSDINRGNFLELLSMRCKDLPWLKIKLQSQLSKHAQWTSPDIQNEILHIIAEHVLDHILKDVRDSGKFSIIVDETSDISRQEQVAICLSYVTEGTKREAFIRFYLTESWESEVLFNLVKKTLDDCGLNAEDIVGKCFDGAANMSGANKGLATRMKECSPQSLYVHCYAHLLNLAIQASMTQVQL